MLSVHSYKLKSCQDGQLLNPTFHEQASWRRFTSIQFPFFRQLLTTCSSCISGRGNKFHERMCRTRWSILGPFAYEADTLPTELPLQVFRHYELISKFNVGLKSLLHQGLSEPEFYGDLVYKFKKIRGMTDFSDQFRKIIIRYKRIGYNLNVMRQSACLVINPITVDGYAALFNCTPVDRASDSMMAPT